jgi:hypothetical protein
MLTNRLITIFPVGFWLIFAGCTPGGDHWTNARPPVYKAAGRVLLDGQPLEGVQVVLHCQELDLTATGRTDQSGRFTLTTYNEGDGFVEGTHSVSLSKRIWEEKRTRYDSPDEPQKVLIPKETLPKRYTDAATSQLTATIEKRGKNQMEFQLTSR